jgi:hypothetical protein
MRFPILAALAPLFTLAAADYMNVKTSCGPWTCSSSGVWHSAYGAYPIDANEGCRDPPDVPGMNSICMDWGSKRAHFFFDNQPKRCLVKGPDTSCGNWDCYSQWSEVACTW